MYSYMQILHEARRNVYYKWKERKPFSLWRLSGTGWRWLHTRKDFGQDQAKQHHIKKQLSSNHNFSNFQNYVNFVLNMYDRLLFYNEFVKKFGK